MSTFNCGVGDDVRMLEPERERDEEEDDREEGRGMKSVVGEGEEVEEEGEEGDEEAREGCTEVKPSTSA